MKSSTKKGFSVVEVLITIGIIGTIAALVIPTLIGATSEKTKARKIENIEYKLQQGTSLMKTQGQINGFNNTSEFVHELSKFIKIQTICEGDNLEPCWPGVNISGVTINGRTERIIINKAEDASWFRLNTNDYTQPVGFIMGDGTPVILSYNRNCEIDSNDARSNGLACVSGIYDINGGSQPNRYGDSTSTKELSDIVPINAIKGIAGVPTCALDISGTCITSKAFTTTPLSSSECLSVKDKLGIQNCRMDDKDYWGGAVKQCGGVSKMLSSEQLAELAQEMYLTSGGAKPVIGVKQEVRALVYQPNSKIAKALGLTPPYYLWSGEEASSTLAYYRHFDSNYSFWHDYDRKGMYIQAVCIEK